MAYDSQLSFPITVSLEGEGIIKYVWVANWTQYKDSEWFEGAWQTPLPIAAGGDDMSFYVEVKNTGAVIDTLFIEIDTTAPLNESSYIEELINANNYMDFEWTFTMPSNDVNIGIGAGHIE